jgi:hypothetical protein
VTFRLDAGDVLGDDLPGGSIVVKDEEGISSESLWYLELIIARPDR